MNNGKIVGHQIFNNNGMLKYYYDYQIGYGVSNYYDIESLTIVQELQIPDIYGYAIEYTEN
jgi:hypothetical protein